MSLVFLCSQDLCEPAYTYVTLRSSHGRLVRAAAGVDLFGHKLVIQSCHVWLFPSGSAVDFFLPCPVQAAVARHLQERLLAARHGNGARLCVLYGAWPGAGGLLSREGPAQATPGSAALSEAVLARQDAGGSGGHGVDGKAEQQPGQHAQHDAGDAQRGAERAERGGAQLGALQGVHQAVARHKALQRTQVLQHGQRRRRSRQAPPDGASAGADWPRYATLGRLSSIGSGGSDGRAPVSRTESFGTEGSGRYSEANTVFYSPRSSISEDGSAASGSVTRGSVAAAAEGAAAPAGGQQAPDMAGPAAAAAADGDAAGSLPSAPSGTTASFQADSSGRVEAQSGWPSEVHVNGTGLPWYQNGEGWPEGVLRWDEQLLRQRGVAGQGPVVAFNVLRADGSFVGYRQARCWRRRGG